MSLSVTALSLSMGSQGLVAGANSSCLRARAGYSLNKSPAHHRALADEQHGVQHLAQGHFNMQLSPARSRDLNQQPFNH